MSGKFDFKHPLPNEYEAELLDNLIEEAAEVIQRATKLKRFGRDEVQPGQKLNNAQRLSMEIGNLCEMIDLAMDARLVVEEYVEAGISEKHANLPKFMRTYPAGDEKVTLPA